MGLISKMVNVSLSSRNVKYYEILGYYIPRYIDKRGRIVIKHGTEIKVKVEDLTKGSHAHVKVKCDNCNKIIDMIFIYQV